MSYYDFVPVSSTLRTVLEPDSRKKFENIFTIEPSFKLKTDLHISSGAKRVVKQNNRLEILLLHYKNSEGLPVIPASSFKGAVSINFLALTGDEKMTANLFGATKTKAVISKVLFSDLKPERGEIKKVMVQRQWQPSRPKTRHVKFYIKKAPSTQSYGLLECIPAGSVLRGKLFAYNVSKVELGGLITAMGFGIENSTFKLGYGKPQGFGQMIPSDIKVSELKLDGFELKRAEVNAKDSMEEFRKKFGDRISKFSKIIFAGV